VPLRLGCLLLQIRGIILCSILHRFQKFRFLCSTLHGFKNVGKYGSRFSFSQIDGFELDRISGVYLRLTTKQFT
jgi:hypothetical protein